MNALELLDDVLPRKRILGTIGFGSMNDPYMPVEKKYRMTRGALEIIKHHVFPVHILTKSDLVLRDIDLLSKIGELYTAVSFTITTADDDLATKIEPGASLPSARFQAMRTLADSGILTGVTMMPILPFLEDSQENIKDILSMAKDSGASYIIPAFGVSLRPGSRDYYYQKLDLLYPGVKEKYIKEYGESYQCSVPNWRILNQVFEEDIKSLKLLSKIPVFTPVKRSNKTKQIPLFN